MAMLVYDGTGGVTAMIPANISTRPEVLAALKKDRMPATRAGLLDERVSYIYGNLPGSSEVTRDKVHARLTELEGLAA